jgi:vacuolar-type H+-ATPase subunit H
MMEIQDASQVEEGIFSHSLNDYRSKVGEIIRTENERFRQLAEEQAQGIIDSAWQKAETIVNESQGKAAKIIADSEEQALSIISDSRDKASDIGKKMEEEAKRRASDIIAGAEQEAGEILREAEERAEKEAKNRVKSQEEKILNKARREADSIIAEARKNAEKETDAIVEKTKAEAEGRVEEELEKFRLQAREQAAQIRVEAEKKASKLIEKIIADGNVVNDMIIEAIKNSESFLENMKNEMQLEVGELTRGLTTARASLEQTVTRFSEKTDDVSVLQNPHKKQNKNLALWVTLKGDKTYLEAEGDFMFQGQMELKTLSSVEYTLVKELKGFLTRVPNVKYLGESSSEEGTILTFEIQEPLPLIDILGNIPLVQNVVTQGDNISLSLN